jgi:predicted nucleic acid-binding protein
VLCVTSDTNVIVSALNFPGNSSRILDLAEAGEIRLAVSDDILNEVKRVLLRPKFGWSQDRVDAAIRQIAGFAEHASRSNASTSSWTTPRITESLNARPPAVRITSLAGITTYSRSGSIRVARS